VSEPAGGSAQPVTHSRRVYSGRVIGVRVDSVRMSDGTVADREIVEHPGAVVIVALDDAGRVVLVNQYRHAVGRRLDELPAGLLDVAGEVPLAAAGRELAEEAGLAAGRWDVLLDLNPSPGTSSEAVRVYLARELSARRPDGFRPEHEELTLSVRRVPLATAVRMAQSGELTNAAAVAGVLAAAAAVADGGRGLRPADAPWPAGSRG
jgi:ADP-ribose pyrophosphatase